MMFNMTTGRLFWIFVVSSAGFWAGMLASILTWRTEPAMWSALIAFVVSLVAIFTWAAELEA